VAKRALVAVAVKEAQADSAVDRADSAVAVAVNVRCLR
jgi:hypothetical protein